MFGLVCFLEGDEMIVGFELGVLLDCESGDIYLRVEVDLNGIVF